MRKTPAFQLVVGDHYFQPHRWMWPTDDELQEAKDWCDSHQIEYTKIVLYQGSFPEPEQGDRDFNLWNPDDFSWYVNIDYDKPFYWTSDFGFTNKLAKYRKPTKSAAKTRTQ